MDDINNKSENKVPYFGANGENKFIIETPDYFKMQIIQEFGLYFDPCPVNPTKDGLEIDWKTDTHNYVNPPYTRGNIAKWVEKCSIEHSKGCEISLLIPAYTDTKYFHDFIYQKPYVELRFLKGRMKFKGYTRSASFPSMLVIFHKKNFHGYERGQRCPKIMGWKVFQ